MYELKDFMNAMYKQEMWRAFSGFWTLFSFGMDCIDQALARTNSSSALTQRVVHMVIRQPDAMQHTDMPDPVVPIENTGAPPAF